MMMFLAIVFMSVLALAVCSAMFAGSAPRDKARLETRPEQKLVLAPPRFFGDVADPARTPGVPVETVLSQIERHIRLEQAAAESFVDVPTAESLHSRTPSPFVN
jgi:hypothetical protein